MNDMDAALKEADRAINDLRLRGVLIYTPVNDKPLDSPEFMPLYEKMSQYNLPMLIHPMRNPDYPDYRTENESKYRIYNTFGWAYETTAAMTRIDIQRHTGEIPEREVCHASLRRHGSLPCRKDTNSFRILGRCAGDRNIFRD